MGLIRIGTGTRTGTDMYIKETKRTRDEARQIVQLARKGGTVELNSDQLLDILKGRVDNKIPKNEVLQMLTVPSEFAAAVKRVTADQKEGFLLLKIFSRLARKEKESDPIVQNSFEALCDIRLNRFNLSGDEEDEFKEEFLKWTDSVDDLTSVAAKREILEDSIVDTRKRIAAPQDSLKKMEDELKELK